MPLITEFPYPYAGGIAKHVRKDYPDGHKEMYWTPRGVRISDLPLWNGDLLDERRFDGEPVLLVEGEKDANLGVRAGFCCVSLPGGASQRDFGTSLQPLLGRWVVLIPDTDPPGRDLMLAVAESLKPLARKISRVDLDDSDHDLGGYLKKYFDLDPVGSRELLKSTIKYADVVFP